MPFRYGRFARFAKSYVLPLPVSGLRVLHGSRWAQAHRFGQIVLLGGYWLIEREPQPVEPFGGDRKSVGSSVFG